MKLLHSWTQISLQANTATPCNFRVLKLWKKTAMLKQFSNVKKSNGHTENPRAEPLCTSGLPKYLQPNLSSLHTPFLFGRKGLGSPVGTENRQLSPSNAFPLLPPLCTNLPPCFRSLETELRRVWLEETSLSEPGRRQRFSRKRRPGRLTHKHASERRVADFILVLLREGVFLVPQLTYSLFSLSLLKVGFFFSSPAKSECKRMFVKYL